MRSLTLGTRSSLGVSSRDHARFKLVARSFIVPRPCILSREFDTLRGELFELFETRDGRLDARFGLELLKFNLEGNSSCEFVSTDISHVSSFFLREIIKILVTI